MARARSPFSQKEKEAAWTAGWTAVCVVQLEAKHEVNPSALTAHDPPVIDMSLADLRDLMTPDGQGLADAFPQLHLRDLPLFEWMPNKTLPKEWLNPVDAELPEFLDFLPESVGRMSLQARSSGLIQPRSYRLKHSSGSYAEISENTSILDNDQT